MKIKFSFILLSTILVGSIFLFIQIVRSANSDIVINEICPSGCVSNKEKQWIEIFNKGNDPVDIAGWYFYVQDESNHRLTTTSLNQDFSIPGNNYAVICEDKDQFINSNPSFSGLLFDSSWTHSLPATGGLQIGLKYDNEADTWVESPFNYPLTVTTSLERVSADISSSDLSNWKQNYLGNTVGLLNYWTSYVPPVETPSENQAPVAVIGSATSTDVGQVVEFDGSDSVDTDGIIQGYEWKINNLFVTSTSIFSYQFPVAGIFAVNLSVTDDDEVIGIASTSILVNELVSEPNTSTSTVTTTITFGTIYINEFLPDPSTSTEHEWIELYNPNTSTVDLTGWTLSDAVGVIATPTGTIESEGYFVVQLSASHLNNTGDSLILKNSLNEVVDSVAYGTTALKAPDKGNTLARTISGSGSFQETTVVTKGVTNTITAPLVVVKQSSSGGGITNANTIEQNQIINQTTGNIIINELFPNPKNSDTENEFIELKNVGSNSVNLKDWILSDATGMKYKIKDSLISSGSFIVLKRSVTNISLNNSGEETVKLHNPAGSLVDQTKYSGTVDEETSWARKNDNIWGWTTKSTPGQENIFVEKNLPPLVAVSYPTEIEVDETAVFDASDTTDPEGDSLKFTWHFSDEEKNGEVINYVFTRAGERSIELAVDDGHGSVIKKKFKLTVIRPEDNEQEVEITSGGSTSTKKVTVKKSTSGKVVKAIENSTLENVKNFEVTDRVRVEGVVAVLPGVFGSQYFYVIDPVSGYGSQIYSYKKDFPALKIGDKVQVVGEISQSAGEKRIKTTSKNDIKKIGTVVLPEPKQIEIADIDESLVGSFLQVQGEVTEVKTANLFVDDGSEEIKVYFKKGVLVNSADYKLGDIVKVDGLIAQTKTGLQILPRSAEDIIKTGVATSTLSISKSGANTEGQVAETYLTATAGGLTSILIGLFAKARGKLVLLGVKKVGKIAFSLFRKGPPKV